MAVILTKPSQSKLFLLCQNISWVGVVIKTAHENIFFILKALWVAVKETHNGKIVNF